MLLLFYISSFSGKCAVTDYLMLGLGIILAKYLLSGTILSRKLCTNEYYTRGLLSWGLFCRGAFGRGTMSYR